MKVRRPTRLGSLPLTLLAALTVTACGGDGPTGPGDERVVLANPSFATHIQEIFVRQGCTASACHGSSGGTGASLTGLLLTSSAANNFTALVNVDAASEPSFKRVMPGNAQNSYLVIKIEGRQSVGVRMPSGGPALDTIDVNNIRNWIQNGAPNN